MFELDQCFPFKMYVYIKYLIIIDTNFLVVKMIKHFFSTPVLEL